MTVKSNLDAAVTDLKAELDAMGFLDPGAKGAVDQELIDAIQADMDTLVASYSATFTSLVGDEHAATAEEMAHWLFDGLEPSEHGVRMALFPTSASEQLSFTTVVPFPWR